MHARDPERLAGFYQAVFGCEILLPLTRLGPEASAGVGVPGSDVSILVLSLPGPGDDPTLELISMGADSTGEGMLTFHVDSVEDTAAKVVATGGSYKGKTVEFVGPSGNTSRFVFMADPEGNTIDLVTRV